MDKKTLTIIALVLILTVIGGAYAYSQIEKKGYADGFKDATLLINQQIINNIIRQGFINVLVPINNEKGNSTYQVKLGVINSTRIA